MTYSRKGFCACLCADELKDIFWCNFHSAFHIVLFYLKSGDFLAVHVFLMDEGNFEICTGRGLVGIPKPNEGRNQNSVFDAMLSRLSMIRKDDYILMYITGLKELRGV